MLLGLKCIWNLLHKWFSPDIWNCNTNKYVLFKIIFYRTLEIWRVKLSLCLIPLCVGIEVVDRGEWSASCCFCFRATAVKRGKFPALLRCQKLAILCLASGIWLHAMNKVHLFRGTNLFQYECLWNFHITVKGALCHILTPAYQYVLKLPIFSMERFKIGGGSCNFLMVRLELGLLYD